MERKDMDPKVQEALGVLDSITPSNLHLITNATWGQRVDFESLWFSHSAQSARYSLLPFYWNKTLFVVDEPTRTHS